MIQYLKTVFGGQAIRVEEVASALQEMGLLQEVVLKTKEGFDVVFNHTKDLMEKVQDSHYGVELGLFLRYELHLTWDDMLRVTQAACKSYNRESDSYLARPLLYHPYRKGQMIKVSQNS